MQIVVSGPIKGVREKERIKALILGAIREIALTNVSLDDIIFTFPERSQDKIKIKLITDFRSGEVIGVGVEKETKTAICLALKPVVDIQEGDITIRDFDVAFNDYC